ncbi:uncharacterized mitochondrial protein AtMg00810-like [Impatiens glandulifera]|uniref:uncharacterized mitochondrial protein AtMg00810-like n=1 Tax=Impatiens glandulifera TaxID=253017 RepID=UPI001FB11FC0|nr:uncharacterized mitochondrial protein AtMg00810-like [Impatiens glandulifera]
MVVVLLYVDDIILTTINYDEVARLLNELSLRFEMKKFDELRTFFGLQIKYFEKDPRPYRALVESLIYLTITRPDIGYGVGVLSRYIHEPRKPHLEKAKKILKYINTSLDICLLYEKDAKCVLQGFADADFVEDQDDRRSMSGFVFLCGNTNISWSSRKHGSISLSTTEV